MVSNNILIIEDDEEAALWTKNFLQECGFDVTLLSTITDAISSIQFHNFDFLLLDLNLPDYNGFELLKFINKNHISISTIILSSYNDKKTKLQAFKYGACDYMTKPIDLEELEARIWVHINNNSLFEIEKKKNIFEKKDHNIYFQEKNLKLTKLEFDIFSILLNNSNHLTTREKLVQQLSSKSNARSLDYHIRNIRKKIGDDGSNPHYLVTEYGLGYKLIV